MKTYPHIFVNYEQNDETRVPLMAEFVYKNTKNIHTDHTPFELYCGYHLHVFYEEDINPRWRSRAIDKRAAKLRKLMIVYKKNLQHHQKLLERAHDRNVEPRSYALRDKVRLNSKYIKTQQNRKPEAKFFDLF